MQSYDYARREGIESVSWERFAALSRSLAEALAPHRIDTVVGVARAGLFPAAAVACALRCDLFPVRVTRRSQDRVVHDHPVWKVDVSPEVAARRVVVIDEIADTGETLTLVARRVRELGAKHVMTAALVSHGWADPPPDVSALVSDALVVFPWDRQVLLDARWQLHPELAGALGEQAERGAAGDHDVHGVLAVESAYDAAWNAGAVDALVGCFTADAVLVNPRGETASGIGEIRDRLGAFLLGEARESRHESRIARVSFPSPDVAIVDGEARVTNAATFGTLTHRFTDVLVRQDQRWRIAHVRACPTAEA